MGYWNDMAAEIERVLGDQLNPTDRYGRPIAVAPRQRAKFGSGDFQNSVREPAGPPFASINPISIGYQVSEKEERGSGIPVPGPPWPAVPGSKRYQEIQKAGRDFQRWLDSITQSKSREEVEEERRCDKVFEDCSEKCSDEVFPTYDYGNEYWICLRDCMHDSECPYPRPQRYWLPGPKFR